MTDETSTRGRKPIFGEKMAPKEIQERHRQKLRSEGGKILQATIKDKDLVDVLQKYREAKGLRSDTAAVNEILAKALKGLQSKF